MLFIWLYAFLSFLPCTSLSFNYYLTFMVFHFLLEAEKNWWGNPRACEKSMSLLSGSGKYKEPSLLARALLEMKNSSWEQYLSFSHAEEENSWHHRIFPSHFSYLESSPKLLLWEQRSCQGTSAPAHTPLLPFCQTTWGLINGCTSPRTEVWQPNSFFMGKLISLKPLIFPV